MQELYNNKKSKTTQADDWKRIFFSLKTFGKGCTMQQLSIIIG